mmetsp:Transcript_28242/g.62030  ORF Transcript_28242/g.62030 Transcript_28242/m.62030 type:complete len:202 (-) Transcript_28242:992-1597(-)
MVTLRSLLLQVLPAPVLVVIVNFVLLPASSRSSSIRSSRSSRQSDRVILAGTGISRTDQRRRWRIHRRHLDLDPDLDPLVLIIRMHRCQSEPSTGRALRRCGPSTPPTPSWTIRRPSTSSSSSLMKSGSINNSNNKISFHSRPLPPRPRRRRVLLRRGGGRSRRSGMRLSVSRSRSRRNRRLLPSPPKPTPTQTPRQTPMK